MHIRAEGLLRPSRKWTLAFGMAGLVVFVIAWPFYFSPLARIGYGAGYNPPTYVIVHTLQVRARDNRRLTDVEMATLRALSDNKDLRIRTRALTALFYLGGTAQVARAAEIARSKQHDPEALVRIYSLNALSLLGAPDTRQVARAMLSDPSADVRQNARGVLGLPPDPSDEVREKERLRRLLGMP